MIKITGLGQVEKELKKLEQKVARLDGSHELDFAELFNAAFMRTHTSHSSFDSLIKAGGYEVTTQEDFEEIPKEDWDSHIREHTSFDDWLQMQEKAVNEWALKQLGF